MAAYKGLNKTKIDAMVPADILSPGLMGGNVRIMIDSYTGVACVAADTIKVGGTLPVGAKVIDIMVSNPHASTFTLGDAESVARYNASIAATAIEHIDVLGAMNYEVDMTTASTPDNQILLTVVGAAMDAALTLKVAIIYTVE